MPGNSWCIQLWLPPFRPVLDLIESNDALWSSAQTDLEGCKKKMNMQKDGQRYESNENVCKSTTRLQLFLYNVQVSSLSFHSF